MGIVNDIGNAIHKAITQTPRNLSVFVFTVFALGVVIGSLVTIHQPDMLLLAVLIPIALAFLSYINTTFAVISFVIFVILIIFI